MKSIKHYTSATFLLLSVFFIIPSSSYSQGNGLTGGFERDFGRFENPLDSKIEGQKPFNIKKRKYEELKINNTIWHVPNKLSKNEKDEIFKTIQKLQEICPNCAQAPIIHSGSPITSGLDFSATEYRYNPNCPSGHVFDSKLGICVDVRPKSESDQCLVPNWLSEKIPFLEKAAMVNKEQQEAFEKDKCQKRYVLFLIDMSMKYAEKAHEKN